jgi:ubiquinone biosynthesis protein COQ9
MDDQSFEQAVVAAAFRLAGQQGWNNVSAASAARFASLDLVEARHSLASRMAIFARFGVFADMHALSGAMTDGTVKDRLFDILMRRVDFLQQHREGVLALERYAPLDPLLTLWLARQTVRSMGWMLEGAGVSAKGIRGELRKRGLAVVWTWTMRAWARDESEELTATMAALDNALLRAGQVAVQFSGAPSRRDDAIVADASFSAPEDTPDRLL